MKSRFSMAIIASLLCCIIFSSCKKGDTGEKGTDGNANVKLFNFGPTTFSGGAASFILPGVTQGLIDSSMVIVFYNPSGEASTAWYPAPGLGSSGAYSTRYFIYQTVANPVQYSLAIRLVNANGSGAYVNSVTFNKTRVFLAPAGSIVTGRNADGRVPGLDYSDYYQVCSYYRIAP